MEVKIKDAKILTVGRSHYITVPKQYISNGMIDVDEPVDATITQKEVEE